MRSRLAITLALAALLVAPTAAADFLQRGGDAARTNAISDVGPSGPDVALRLRLPEVRAPYAYPLVLGRTAYVLTTHPERGHSNASIFAVGLDDGSVRRVASYATNAYTFASDGARFFVTLNKSIEATDVATGERVWSRPLPDPYPVTEETACASVALTNDALYAACVAQGERDPTGEAGDAPELYPERGFAVALDKATGALRWMWAKDAAEDARFNITSPDTRVPDVSTPPLPRTNATSANPVAIGLDVSVVGPHVFVGIVDLTSPQGAIQENYWVLDKATGSFAWAYRGDYDTQNNAAQYQQNLPLSRPYAILPAMPTGDDRTVALKYADLALRDHAGREVWRLPLTDASSPSDVQRTAALLQEENGLALYGNDLYVLSRQSLVRVDLASFRVVWHAPIEGTEIALAWRGFYLVNNSLYHLANTQGGVPVLFAYDASDGQPLWGKRLEGSQGANSTSYLDQGITTSIASGVLVAAFRSEDLLVIGTTGASIAPAIATSSEYPAPGERVTLDASGTRAGIQAAHTTFAIDWGDGSHDADASATSFSHAYATAGEYLVNVTASNDAGQSSTRTLAIHVGASPPNFISTAFDNEHQNTTFFVLGLVVTALAALLAALRIRRRRSLLRRELTEAERVAREHRTRPVECERLLAERKTQARVLHEAGRLDDAQFALLTGRIDELSRALRLGIIDEDLAFLPVGVARVLQGLLADGRIERWEREHFAGVLARDPHLTPEQKARVQALVDEWLARDVAGTRA